MGEVQVESKLKELEAKEEEEAQIEIWNIAFGFTKMAVVKCAIELGIAEAIENHGGPITLSELSTTLKCAPESLHRIMRFLVHYKIFKQEPTSQSGSTGYVHTPMSLRLLRNGEKSMAGMILLESSPVMLHPWHLLSAIVKGNGSTAFNMAHGKDLWEFTGTDPDHSKLFDAGMAVDAKLIVPAMAEGCPQLFDGIQTLVDVGGGNGITLSWLVKTFPWIQGINYDLPTVASVAPEYPGVKHVSGDMFMSVPKADAAIIKWVLHDWNDEDCIKILRNCKEAVAEGKGGKVIIIEAVVDAKKDDKLEFARLMLDMIMMAHTKTGKERTSQEWEYVLLEAGFSRYTITPLDAVQSVIEAFP